MSCFNKKEKRFQQYHSVPPMFRNRNLKWKTKASLHSGRKCLSLERIDWILTLHWCRKHHPPSSFPLDSGFEGISHYFQQPHQPLNSPKFAHQNFGMQTLTIPNAAWSIDENPGHWSGTSQSCFLHDASHQWNLVHRNTSRQIPTSTSTSHVRRRGSSLWIKKCPQIFC